MKRMMMFGMVLVVLAMVTSPVTAGMLWTGDPYLRGDDAITIDGVELSVSTNLMLAEVGAIPVLETVLDPITGFPVIDPLTGYPTLGPVLIPALDPITGDPLTDPVTGDPVLTPKLTAPDNVSLSLVNGASLVVDEHFRIGFGMDDPLLGGRESAPESGGTATFTMDATSTVTTGQDIEVTYFAGTTGIANFAGTITVGDDFRVSANDHAQEGTAVGVAILNDATMTVGGDNDGIVEVGRYGNGTLTLNGTSSITGLHSSSDFEIGEAVGGVGVVNMNGTSAISFNDKVRIGEKGGHGTLNMNDASTFYINDDVEMAKSGGTAVINMSGTSVFTVNDFVKMAENEGNATINITDDAQLLVGDDFQVGMHGTGTINISGNALIDIEDDLELGQKGDGIGTLYMSGGTIDIKDDFEMSKGNLDDAGTSFVYMSGGTITVGDDFKMAQKEGTATLVMTAGMIVVGDAFNVTHENQAGTTATVVLGDGSDPAALFGIATIKAGKVDMGDILNGDAEGSIDVLPGGLLQLDGDVTAYIQELMDADLIGTSFTGLINGYAAEVGYDFGITEADITSVYLVPEPATMVLLGLGGLVLRRRKR